MLIVFDELLGIFFVLGLGGMVMFGVFCIVGCVGIWIVVGVLICCKKCCVKCCCCWLCCKKCKGLFLLLKILFCLKFLIKFSEFMVMLDLRLFMVLGLWSFFVICKWCLSIIIVIDVINVY